MASADTINWRSRKFLLTVGFVLIVCVNDIFKLGIDTNSLVIIAASLGVYITGNVLQKKQG